ERGLRVPPAAPEADSTDEHVEESAQAPERVPRVPARSPADPADRRKGTLGWDGHVDGAGVDDACMGRRVLGRQPALAGAERIGPAGLRQLAILVGERSGERFTVTHRLEWEELRCTRALHDRVVPQALDELPPDARVDGRDQVEPE